MSEDDVLFPHLQVLHWTSIPADCLGIFHRLVGPSLVDLHIFSCLSADATEYAKLISQRAPGLQRLEMEIYSDSDSKHLLKVKRKPKPKPQTMFQDQVLFPDLRVLRWTSQCSDSPKLFRQLLGPSVVDLHILNSSLANAREYVKIIRQRTHGLQRLEVNLDHNDHLEPLPELELDGMDINKLKTNCTLSEEAFFSLATMTHLTSLELAVPEEGYAEVPKEGDEDTPQEVFEEVPEEDHKDVPEEVYEEVPHTSCFPALRSLRLETEELGKHCTALVKKMSSSNLDSISVDVKNDVTTDMLESFVRELVNYPLREFSLACTASNIRHDHDDGLDIAEATLHALQPLLQHRAMTLLAISINNLRITSHLLSALDSAYPALKMLLLHTDSSHSPEVDILSTLADSFPSLKEADISVTDTWKLLTLPRDWQSHSKLSTLRVVNTIWYWVSDSKVLAYLKALFPRAYIGLS
ncbi:uncharacterized protein LAESUDRAFT_728969 [Laetiporus sulphureus 93-53]|uniref:F-box domain-containing protein n=1 Tax=Laetiporus sulphureus 93-53 TaxID=1314785 RepID=A0A165CXK6_9APHY|nr:uncharacterized protein LAESUDRAFT_728969 [Laetiporus sulphureus 93-53]KZT03680.1 hypothetical protein LAESUDRAFT_728969 [Laetiporus sulphureus 93-53]